MDPPVTIQREDQGLLVTIRNTLAQVTVRIPYAELGGEPDVAARVQAKMVCQGPFGNLEEPVYEGIYRELLK